MPGRGGGASRSKGLGSPASEEDVTAAPFHGGILNFGVLS